MPTYEFAIKKEKSDLGVDILVPVCRKKMFSVLNKWNIYPWERIIKIYDEYYLMELPNDRNFNLTALQCREHIKGYQAKLESEVNNPPKISIEVIDAFTPKKYKNGKEYNKNSTHQSRDL